MKYRWANRICVLLLCAGMVCPQAVYAAGTGQPGEITSLEVTEASGDDGQTAGMQSPTDAGREAAGMQNLTDAARMQSPTDAGAEAAGGQGAISGTDDLGEPAETSEADLAGDPSVSAGTGNGAEEAAGEESWDAGAQKEADGQDQEKEKEENHVITGFPDSFGPVVTIRFSCYEKPSYRQAAAALPEELTVYLDGESEVSRIPVRWECAGDFENSSFFYYQFDPVWEKDRYLLQSSDPVPYAAVELTAGASAGEEMARAKMESAADNEKEIFQYLTGKMGLPASAACGIMANIYCESSFYADIEEITTRTDKGYGLCQWTFGRRTDLVNYCTENHYNYKTVDGQMHFLEYELLTSYTGLLAKLQSAANTAQGAYQAGYDWCYDFERPYNYGSVSISRGNLAKDKFWPVYSIMPITKITDSTKYLRIIGQTVPSAMNVGSSFSIRGTVTSSSVISSLTVGVYDAAGKMKIGKTVSPNAKLFSLSNVDEDIVFSKLTAGVYRYRVTAVNSEGSKDLVNSTFAMLSNSQTIAGGTYQILSAKDNAFAAGIAGGTVSENTSLVLDTKKTGSGQQFTFQYQSGGYYQIRHADSGKYLTVAGQSAASGSGITLTQTGTLWQVLPDGAGNYYLVPKCATACSMDLKGGKLAAGTNIQSYTHNLSAAQRWKLTAVSAAPAQPATVTISLTGQSLPTALKTGAGFDIKGKVTSGQKISSLTVGVYDAAGKMKIGKTVSPGTTSYDLAGVDSAIRFGQLTAGGYTYKITATAGGTTKTLASAQFVVLANAATVANGTYRIVTSKNASYDLIVSGSLGSSGAALQLTAASGKTSEQFKFIHQSSGNYKIQNVNSGLYLTTQNQSVANNAKLVQAAAASLWQVLPDGNGAYYLVPVSATGRAADLKGGTVANGQTIQLYTANGSAAQRWKLTAVSAAPAQPATVTISLTGQSLPTALKAGSGFGIKGKVTSSQKISSLTVGVYDAAGKMKIGKTVSPGTTSYDLAGVDSAIRFGQLTAGGYTYKITATASGTTKTLASAQFVVLANAATVANGTYRIVTSKNTSYDLIVSGSLRSSGAALQLTAASGKTSEKFKFIHQSGGNYKIQNVNSGLYLTTQNQSVANNAKLVQAAAASLWQVLPDGNGAYYLVPAGATGRAIDLKGGTVANGQTIQLYTANGSAAQRWKLTAVSAASAQPATVTISLTGQSLPTALKAGSGFGIKGKVTSSQKISSLTVGVYDASGKMKIGKTVSPGTTSYDLAGVDSAIRFGQLAAGGYTYKITATAGGTTKTLASTQFVVLANAATVANGTYRIVTSKNASYDLIVSASLGSSGAALQLTAASGKTSEKFKFIYQSGGNYKIQNVNSGLYLTTQNQSVANNAKLIQAAAASLWQVLPDGNGAYYLVPAGATGRAADLKGGTVANGQTIQLYTANGSGAQRWILK